MRKPLVSRTAMAWLSTVTVQSLLITAVVLGPLFTPISLVSALKLNGTTPAPPTSNLTQNAVSEDQTTLASFLQPENSETTLHSQLSDEFITSSTSPLAKRHSSIQGVAESASQNRGSPRFLTKTFSNSAESDSHSSSKEKPQKNGTGDAEEEGEQASSSVGLTTAEQNEGDGDDDNALPSTTARGNDSGGGVSVSMNSLGVDNEDGTSMSLDKDESDTYFSGGGDEDDETNTNANEGDSATTDDDVGGETATEDIFPPDDNNFESDESGMATTYAASLLRSPDPTSVPQSFSAQLAIKLGRAPGSGRQSNRLGTRGLSAKSERNAISSLTPSSSTVPPTTTSSPSSSADAIIGDSIASDSSSAASTVIIEKTDISSADNHSDNTTRLGLNGSRFHSRSNANSPQPSSTTQQQLLRARPTSSVINYSSNSNSSHNNNLHNRIIKRKKLPFGRGNVTAGGSSLSSIYNNSILTSTPVSSGTAGVEVSTAPTIASSSDNPLSLSANISTGVEASTESNSLSNASHDEKSGSNANIEVNDEQQANKSSPAFISGADVASGSHNLTSTPVTPLENSETSSSNSSSSSSNNSSSLSSSRAILGFGPTSVSNHGKVKRPKPIIIRDHDESVYINNISENNAGTTEHTSGRTNQEGNSDDETATSSDGVAGEDANKPVGSNALPTPPVKIRRVKLPLRRVPSTPRPPSEIDATTSSTTKVLTSTQVSTEDSTGFSISSTNSLMAQAASDATDYLRMRNVIKPSMSREDVPPLFSSNRVFKEEFGFSHTSYGSGDNDDDGGDHDHDTHSHNENIGNDGELQATTEYYSSDSSTPYPITMGVRTKPAEEESVIDNDEDEKIHAANVDGRSRSEAENSGSDNRYRDYYSEIRSASGNGGGNLHIKSDAEDKSPVTVTVTHTVVQSTPTPQITPTATKTEQDTEQSKYGINDGNDEAYLEKRNNGEGSSNNFEQENNPNLHPTPALPSSVFVSPTPTQSTLETSRGPSDTEVVSTSRYEITSGGFRTTQYGQDDVDEGNDQENKQEDKHEDNYEHSTPVTQQVQPTPVISTKGMKSVYFTQVEHPHYTSSSYEFTTSSTYSYTFPDHDTMHMMNHGDDDHDHESHEHDATPYPPYEDDRSSYPHVEPRNTQEMNDNETTISDGTYFTPSSPSPMFWDDSGNLTKSSSSQIPVKTDQENRATVPTPTIDIDIYPPIGIEPDSKVEDSASTTPVPSTVSNIPSSSRVPGSMEDNEISEEELRKQQQSNNAGSTSTAATTTKPFLSPSNGVSNNKDKGEEVDSADETSVDHDDGLSKDENVKVHGDNEKGESDFKNDTSSGDSDNAKTSSKEEPSDGDATTKSAGSKTPFGKGESFGIGNVHVPIMVQMDLDVAQPVFCSHLNSFKTMIATVYETQRNVKVDPAQIVIYTEPGCDHSKKSEDSTTHNYNDPDASSSTRIVRTTRKPTTNSGKGQTSKGTYPLTSPPSSRESEDTTNKSRSGKDLEYATSTKNLTGLSESSTTDLNKNTRSKSDSSEINSESAPQNKTLQGIRSRRSTKMSTAATATKNSNFSDDAKASVIMDNENSSTTSITESLLSVYFYVNDKNGSYDQDLTSSFVRLWNDSSRLTNVSDDISNNENVANVGQANGDGHDVGSFDNEVFIKRVKKVGMITASHLLSTQDTTDENSGIIVAITVASVIAVCLLLLGIGLLVMRHRQSQTKFAKRCTPVTLDDYSLDNISVYNSFRRKQRLRGSKRSYTNAAFDDHTAPSRPVNASALASCVSDVAALENEFRAIPNVTATLDDIPNGAETKNRYANVIPMPDTRVLLTFLEDIPNSDYINANYVRGVGGEQKRYIVTQGPLEDTIVDFWRMVWEQQIRVIYMLTDFAEGGIAKCAEYYPRSETIDCSQLHGDFQITLEKRDITDNCITSYLVLKDMERNLRRDIVHFWYHSWPEKGVPASAKMTIDFLNRSRKFTKEPAPILVHCSPGTGRSGTIVACDIAMKEYDAQNTIDIPRLVMKIRQDRAGAVQTKEQYIHIYQVLHSYASRIGGSHLESI